MEKNFISKIKQPWTTYDNGLIQEETIFENANQKLCYMFLYSYANASKIFPSMSAIATAICSSTRTAMRTVKELERLGLIEVKRTQGKSNQYILNDYYEIAESFNTDDKLSPVTNCHDSSDKLSPVPVTNCHPKNKKLKIKTKNKISSSNRDSIDNKLRETYKRVPFDEIKDKMLNESNILIDTDKQYKALLEYRLKNWKPTQLKKRRIARTEVVPDWLKNEDKTTNKKLTDDFEIEKEKLKEELAQLDKDLKKGNL